jgi:hypothetical protein
MINLLKAYVKWFNSNYKYCKEWDELLNKAIKCDFVLPNDKRLHVNLKNKYGTLNAVNGETVSETMRRRPSVFTMAKLLAHEENSTGPKPKIKKPADKAQVVEFYKNIDKED